MIDYSKDIIDILARVPAGLSIRKIVRHVYNAHNSLFETVPLEEVKRDVTQYLTSRAKTASSPIEHAETWGVYRLKADYLAARQLELNFLNQEAETKEEEKEKQTVDTSLDLFEGMW